MTFTTHCYLEVGSPTDRAGLQLRIVSVNEVGLSSLCSHVGSKFCLMAYYSTLRLSFVAELSCGKTLSHAAQVFIAS